MIELLDYRKDKKKLRTPGVRVTSEMISTPEFTANLEQMKIILAKDGVGLAATQSNWSVQLFMLCIDENSEKIEPIIFINPKIFKYSKNKIKMEEGCLSVKNLYLKIERPESITWEYTKLDGSQHSLDSSGFYARAVQHECDHLNGRVFVDLASPVQMLQVKKWLDA